MGKTVTKSFNGGKLSAKDYIDGIILFMKKMTSGGCLPLSWGRIYVYNHYFQASSLKPIDQSMPISCESSLGSGKERLCKGTGHMTKMAAIPIYVKNLQKSSSPEPEVL